MQPILSILLLCLAFLCIVPASAEEAQTFSADEQAVLADYFKHMERTSGLKNFSLDMPVMTQRFGADPWALVYQDRVYLYMTGDVLEKDAAGNVKANTYSRINTLNVVSSADLVNWTDHGCITVAGKGGAAKWGGNSWAPAVAYKQIDGQDRFFLYFANGGNGIGVLTADSPLGPFTDPLGHALVSRTTPNCSNVTWLFDPAVLVDEDGSAYLYFGGGIPSGKEAAPGTARVVRLGDDMISLDGTPAALDVPYLFEDSGINRIGDTYVYSYCTNWNVPASAKVTYGFDNAWIAYMISDSPMGPFTYAGTFLKNPGAYFGCYGNNHHCVFSFHDKWYVAWHTQMLEQPMGISGGYRSTGITQLNVTEGAHIAMVTSAARNKLEQVGVLDPYTWVDAATIAAMAGLDTVRADRIGTCGKMLVTDIDAGDWLAVYGVDFAEGASKFSVRVRAEGDAAGMIQLHIDKPFGPVIGYLTITPGEGWQELTAVLTEPVSGVHDLVMLFDGSGYELDSWQFIQ